MIYTLLISSCIFTDIARVESNFNNQAIGLHGEIGMYQVRKIFVDGVNRICKKKLFSYEDRLKPHRCRAMLRTYWAHYKCYTREQKLRCYNGGPRGMYKQSTLKYWSKYENCTKR